MSVRNTQTIVEVASSGLDTPHITSETTDILRYANTDAIITNNETSISRYISTDTLISKEDINVSRYISTDAIISQVSIDIMMDNSTGLTNGGPIFRSRVLFSRAINGSIFQCFYT